MTKFLSLLFVALMVGCDSGSNSSPPKTAVVARDGVAIAIIVDRSGSMGDNVKDFDGQMRDKEGIAKRAVMQVIKRCEAYSGKPIVLGVYQFDRYSEKVVSFSKPSVSTMQDRVDRIAPHGETAIGDGILAAKEGLDETGLKSRHIVVITDGENNAGTDPSEVVKQFQQLTGDAKINVYVVAFDVDSQVFKVFKDAGWVVLSASDALQLQQSLDQLLGENILLERQ